MEDCFGSGRSCLANFFCLLRAVRLYCSFSPLREKARMRGSIICTLTFILSRGERGERRQSRLSFEG